ncbi:MAG: hypothetical protein QOE61_5667 [Micromonosporaceae bacterium]|nr:hypothetical protein [Micromonosporaceae bacterium]
MAVFSRRGYHPASVDEIAEAAGISKPMVYAYLGTKEELFTACLHREGARLLEALAEAVSQDLSPDEQLRRGLQAFFGFVAAHRDGWNVLYRQARGQEPFADVLAQMRTHLAEVVTDFLARARRTAGLTARPDEVSTMAYAVVGAAEAVADWVVDHPDEDVEVVAERLMKVLWHGTGSLLR